MWWWKPKKSKPSAPLVKVRRSWSCRDADAARGGQGRLGQVPGLLRPVPGRAEHDEVVAVTDQRPQLRPRLAHASSRTWRAMLASSGEIGEPCGVPASDVGDHPALEHPGPQPSPQQLQHLPVNDPALDLGHQGVVVDLVEAALMSASSTHTAPLVGRLADGLEGLVGRSLRAEPEAAGRKSASKIGSRTIFAAAMTTRSRSVGMPSGRVSPGLPGLGMFTRRSGLGR